MPFSEDSAAAAPRYRDKSILRGFAFSSSPMLKDIKWNINEYKCIKEKFDFKIANEQ